MENNEFLFVVNPQAGKGRGLAYKARIEKAFRDWGIKALVIASDGPDSVFSLGKRAAQDGIRTLVGVGGDGTGNLLLNGMMASGVPAEALPRFGVIQVGTGNNFAKNAGVPSSLEEDLAVIRNGHTTSVDVGLVVSGNMRKYFLNVVSFGFDAEITEKARIQKEKFSFVPKALTYGLAALEEIWRGLPSYQLKLQGLGFSFDSRMSLAAALIGPTYGAIFRIAPGADSSDGLFDVCLIDKIDNNLQGKKRAVTILFRATKGTHIGQPEVCLYRTPFLTVSSPDILPCEVDGEVMPTEKEYQVSILPRALRILVPAVLATVQDPLVARVNAPEYQPA